MPKHDKDAFGKKAEAFARYFGTPKFIIIQTVVVVIWIGLNVTGIIHHWDPYPFILLNLMFSTQAAYAAPLILLAQTRQSDRDKAQLAMDREVHRHIANLVERDIGEDTKSLEILEHLSHEEHGLKAMVKELLEHIKGSNGS
jgi:uncharacterized membrane protein